MIFYGTFGVDHPFGRKLQVLDAPDMNKARDLMFSYFGKVWCSVYSAEEYKKLTTDDYILGTLTTINWLVHNREES